MKNCVHTLGVAALVLAAGTAFGQRAARPMSQAQFDKDFAALSLSSLGWPYSRADTKVVWMAKDSALPALAASKSPSLAELALRDAAQRNRILFIPLFDSVLAENPPVGIRPILAVSGLENLPDSPRTRSGLARALSHPDRHARTRAALVLGHRQDRRSIPQLIKVIEAGGMDMFVAAGLAAGMKAKEALPAMLRMEKAASRVARGSDPIGAFARFTMPVCRYQTGDDSALPILRSWFKGPQLRAMDITGPQVAALDAIAVRRGAQEMPLYVSALQGSAKVRERAREWMAHWGDKRASGWLRAAAKTTPPDVENAGWYRSIPARMNETADNIDKGIKAPRPAVTPNRLRPLGLPRASWNTGRVPRPSRPPRP